ncbi:MAG: hypothetical protein IKQ37_06940 [Bacteroidaceae bacterium]|nr:hypothetical protein [Bacteroidaceae bacterium]
MATKNNNNQSVNNQSANSLQYVTYTSAKSGKTIPVLVGFTSKDDPRIAYIAQIGKDGEQSAVHGRYTQLNFDGTMTPCVMWGAAECWHEVAKLAAKTVNDLDTLTQEAYDALCAKASEAYQQRKAESEAQRAEKKTEVKPKSAKPSKPAKKGTQKPTQKAKSAPATKTAAPATKSFEETYPLSYMACTNEKGQIIPAIVGFMPDGYQPRWDYYGDPRIEHICGTEGKASPVNAIESRIELDGKEQICVTFPVGYDDIAKRVAELFTSGDATEKQWKEVCKDAAALCVKPAPAPKAKSEKPAPKKELTINATKKARVYTEESLMKAFAEVAKAAHLSKDNKGTLENFLKAIIKAAA